MTKGQGQKNLKLKKLAGSSLLALAAMFVASPLNHDDSPSSQNNSSKSDKSSHIVKYKNEIPDLKSNYPLRHEKMDVFKENCYSATSNNDKDGAPSGWSTLERLKDKGIISKSIYDIAHSADMYFCWYDDATISGEFSSDYGVGMIYKDEGSENDYLSSAIHSVLTGLHDLQELDLKPKNGSVYTHLTYHLISEAIKETAKIIVAFELSENGDKDFLNSLTEPQKQLLKVFKLHFKQQEKMLNDTNEAISFAASYSINTIIRDKSFVLQHSPKVLSDYFWAIQSSDYSGVADDSLDGELIDKIGHVTKDLSLSEYISIPTKKELLEIGSEVKLYHDYLEYQRLNISGNTSGSSHVDVEDTVTAISLEDVASIINKSSNVYTFPQALDRAKINLESHKPYNDRKGNYFKSCIQVDYTKSQISKPLSPLWNNIQALKRQKTLIGQLALEHAKQEDLFICYSELEDGVGGLWSNDDEGVIKVSSASSDSVDYQLLVKVHEIVHSMQSDKGLLSLKYSWSLPDWQMAIMSYEASAKVADHLLAYELKLNGYEGPWDTIKDEQISITIDKEYQKQKRQGASYKTALELAGSEAWKSLFEQQSWLDFYNKRVLKSYFGYLAKGKTQGLGDQGYTVDIARRTGELSAEFNFTRNIIDLPGFSTRFGNNHEIKQAFEYLNLERMAMVLGRDHKNYLTELERLENNNNKFLGVDISVADNDGDPWVQLRCFAGLDECKIGEEKLVPSKYKIAMRNNNSV
jgi:hypothetical protein